MRHLISALLILSGATALAQFAPPPPGMTSPVNDGAGDQTDPHVSGEIVAYTSEENGGSEIRHHNLATGADSAIPSNGAFDFLSDVSGSLVVFTRVTDHSAIHVFDTANPAATPLELSPQPDSNRRAAAIGGRTVSWQDLGFGPSAAASEIVTYDLVTGATTRLTEDTVLDKNPAVSPDGEVVVFTKCQSLSTGCDIYESKRDGTSWITVALTGTEGEESLPDTSGELTVYASSRTVASVTEQDIFYRPVGAGPESQLELPSIQRNPNISGSLIAFESFDETAQAYDLFVYDVRTQVIYRLTNTPIDESLNDISVASDGLVRVVWTVNEGGSTGFDVRAFSFRLEGPGCDDAPTTCSSPGTRPLLATLPIVRTNGSPNEATQNFAAASGAGGLLCVFNGEGGTGSGGNHGSGHHHGDSCQGGNHGNGHYDGDPCDSNEDSGGDSGGGHGDDDDCENTGHSGSNTSARATSGEVKLNGTAVVRSRDFKKANGLVERAVTLDTQNALYAKIAGKPGTGYTVRVYGAAPSCTPHPNPSAPALRIRAERLSQAIERGSSSSDDGSAGDVDASKNMIGGCSAAGDSLAVMLVALVMGLLLVRPAPVPVRRRRR